MVDGDAASAAATSGQVGGTGPRAAKSSSLWGATSSVPADIPGWSVVSAAMTWAQDPENAAFVVAGASCVAALAALVVLGPRRGR